MGRGRRSTITSIRLRDDLLREVKARVSAIPDVNFNEFVISAIEEKLRPGRQRAFDLEEVTVVHRYPVAPAGVHREHPVQELHKRLELPLNGISKKYDLDVEVN